jgi:hypothetical protein
MSDRVGANTPGPVPFDAPQCAKGVTCEPQARYSSGFPVIAPLSDWSPSIQASCGVPQLRHEPPHRFSISLPYASVPLRAFPPLRLSAIGTVLARY